MFSHRTTTALLVAALAASPATAQEIARLYAARAPAGSVYVRIVNADSVAMHVEFGGKRATLDARHPPATDYRIVDASAPMLLKANGKALAPVQMQAGTFNTVIVADGKALLLTDATDSRDDLKAELRFYNLARGCQATLSLAGGATVFAHVDFQASAKRNINPVKAELTAACAGAGSAAAVALPVLKPGDHVSLFLTGTAARPRLQVQADATEIYSGAR